MSVGWCVSRFEPDTVIVSPDELPGVFQCIFVNSEITCTVCTLRMDEQNSVGKPELGISNF